ncbi:hypothetical protein ACQ4PT_005761 [Festuca glaucescens]
MSYIWRSILHGLEVLKEGIAWWVGDGEPINAWTDPWIPRGSTRRPVATQRVVNHHNELINPSTETWDEDLIRDNFTADDTRDILSIPLNPDMEDSKGLFSVKSAYRLGISLRDAKLQRGASTSSVGETMKNEWQKIWKMDVPGKVKIFLWRFAHNSLRTRKNIQRKCVDLDTGCPVCNRLDEDGCRIFLRCKFVKQVWRNLTWRVPNCNFLHVRTLALLWKGSGLSQLNNKLE